MFAYDPTILLYHRGRASYVMRGATTNDGRRMTHCEFRIKNYARRQSRLERMPFCVL